MPIKFTKNGVDCSFLGSEKLFTKGWQKIQHATKEIFFVTEKNIEILVCYFFFNFKGVPNQIEIKIIMIYIGYWLVGFLDPTNIPNFH